MFGETSRRDHDCDILVRLRTLRRSRASLGMTRFGDQVVAPHGRGQTGLRVSTLIVEPRRRGGPDGIGKRPSPTTASQRADVPGAVSAGPHECAHGAAVEDVPAGTCHLRLEGIVLDAPKTAWVVLGIGRGREILNLAAQSLSSSRDPPDSRD